MSAAITKQTSLMRRVAGWWTTTASRSCRQALSSIRWQAHDLHASPEIEGAVCLSPAARKDASNSTRYCASTQTKTDTKEANTLYNCMLPAGSLRLTHQRAASEKLDDALYANGMDTSDVDPIPKNENKAADDTHLAPP